MPASDSPALLVARFLKSNNYERTLDAFLDEAGLLHDDAATASKDVMTIERVLKEKKLFDVCLNYEKHGFDDTAGWTAPAPSKPTVISLPEAANILSVSVQPFRLGDETRTSLLATTAGRRLSVLQADRSLALLESLSPQDSPILSWTPILEANFSIGTAMSGQVILFDSKSRCVVSERRDHTKFVVRAVAYTHPPSRQTYIATAGWDAKVCLYSIPEAAPGSAPSLSSPLATLSLPSNPEDLVFYECPTPDEPSRLVLVISRRDSTQLHYYRVPASVPPFAAPSPTSPQVLTFLGSQNLSPHASAWTAFSCSAISRCPTDASLVAVATTSIPFLKLIIARLLVPPSSPDPHPGPLASAPAAIPTTMPTLSATDPTQASQARDALAQQEAFTQAIMLHVSTQAPQTPYSTPKLTWRPDGSGVWVNGDDGIVRGVERTSGKVVAALKDGHEAGVKIRDLWAGWVEGDGDERSREEWVVSGGFDKKLVVWRVSDED